MTSTMMDFDDALAEFSSDDITDALKRVKRVSALLETLSEEEHELLHRIHVAQGELESAHIMLEQAVAETAGCFGFTINPEA
jgi:signal transduction histidine kinase